MAFSGVTSRLFTGERVTDAAVAGSPGAAIVTTRWVCVIAAMDNVSTTTGDTTEYAGSDTDGHDWTPLWERTYSPTGAVADAFTIGAFLAQTTAEIGTGDTITVTTSNGTPLAKVLGVFEFQAADPVVMEGSAAYDVADAGATLSGLENVEHLFVGLTIRENESTGVTEDADYTPIGDALSGTAGATTTNLALHLGYRILTGTGDTYLPSGAGSGDRMQVLFALSENAGGTTHELAGTVAGVGSFTGDLVPRRALAGTVAGVSTLAGDLLRIRDLAGSIAGVSTLTGDLLRIRDLAGQVDGVGSFTGDLTVEGVVHELGGTIAGVSSITGNLIRIHDLDGSVAGAGSFTGDLIPIRVLAGQIDGVSTLSGDLLRIRDLGGSVAGVGSLTGNLTIVGGVVELAGEVIVITTMTGDLVIIPREPSSMDYRSQYRYGFRQRR